MDIKWIEKIAEIYGVNAALLVDHDGLVVAQAGTVSENIAPNSALLVKKLIGEIGLDTMGDWIWTQCETNDMILSIANVDIGILVLVMKPDANIGMARIEARNVRRTLQKTFKESFSSD